MVERIARDQYSMIKDGEILVKFYEEGKKRPAESH
jgi:cell division protein FtsB